MKLQSDPTIIYGLVFGKDARPSAHQERYRAADAVQYLCHRRPAAGADRQSGRASIEAAANPARTKELYFVADEYRRTRLRRDLRSASEECRALARVEHELKGEAPASGGATAGVGVAAADGTAQRSKRSAGGSSRNAGAAQ